MECQCRDERHFVGYGGKKMKKRPKLNEISLEGIFQNLKGKMICTMSEGQWDVPLDVFYKNGAILLELDDNEMPVRAFQLVKKI